MNHTTQTFSQQRVLAFFVCAGLFVALTGCELPARVTGSTTMLRTGPVLAPEIAAPERVQLLLEQDTLQDATPIAIVVASAHVSRYPSTAVAEGAALEQLRFQAALADANAVVNIERRIIETGTWTNYIGTGYSYHHHSDNRDRYYRPEIFTQTHDTRVNYEVVLRGTAVRIAR